jgi:hypothetical protein
MPVNAAAPSTTPHADSSRTRQRRIAVIAMLIIGACVAWVAYLITRSGAVAIPEPTDNAAQWMKGYAALNAEHGAAQDALYWAMGSVVAHPTEDRASITVTGTAKSESDIAALKAALSAIQPSIPIQWDIRVRR